VNISSVTNLGAGAGLEPTIAREIFRKSEAFKKLAFDNARELGQNCLFFSVWNIEVEPALIFHEFLNESGFSNPPSAVKEHESCPFLGEKFVERLQFILSIDELWNRDCNNQDCNT